MIQHIRQTQEGLEEAVENRTEQLQRSNNDLLEQIELREAIEDTLRRSEAQLRILTNNASDLICLHYPDMSYRFVSQSVKKVTGYEANTLISTSPYDYYHPNDVASIRHNHDVVALTSDMVAIPSVSQWSNADVTDYIEDWLRANGFDEIERLEYTYGSDERKCNLVAKKGTGTGGLAFLSHSDTVPGMEDSWGAFQPEIKDGRLYGRGSCDMKGPLAATMSNLRLLVLDDYEGELANAPAMTRLRQLVDVTILDHPLTPDSYHQLADYDILLTLRERTRMDATFFDFCTNVQLVLQTGGHDNRWQN